MRNRLIRSFAGAAFGAALALSAGLAHAVQYYDYPRNAVPLFAASGNVANAAITLTFAATPAWVNYVTGFTCTAAGATAASNKTATITGSLATAPSYTIVVPAGATVAVQPLDIDFDPPIVADSNTAIVLTVPALGAGNTHATCNMQGYRIPAN